MTLSYWLRFGNSLLLFYCISLGKAAVIERDSLLLYQRSEIDDTIKGISFLKGLRLNLSSNFRILFVCF